MGNDKDDDYCADEVCDLPERKAAAGATSTITKNEKSFEPGPGKHILLFADPMCSWCWGFQPELKKLISILNNRAQFHVVMGGLRPYTSESWQGEMQTYVHHHWQEVQKKTGQPFDYARMNDDHFIYDTEPACRAVACARELNPEMGLAVYHDLQREFYARGQDITDTDIICEIVANTGVDKEKFLKLFTGPAGRELVEFDFNQTRAFGVKGFPSIVCADDGQYAFLTLGYRTFDAMQGDVEAWLNG